MYEGMYLIGCGCDGLVYTIATDNLEVVSVHLAPCTCVDQPPPPPRAQLGDKTGCGRVQVLSGFPTTTRQDHQALEHALKSTSFHARCLQLALQWRIKYKQSLARAFKMAQLALKEG